MTVAIGATTLIQRIWGAFNSVTGALQGVTTSGEAPYTPVVSIGYQSGLPTIMPSSGSIGTNGALTLNTALPQTYANCYMYFPVGAVFAGSAAGLYFVQMTSTTVGTIYGNSIPAATVLTIVPTVPTAATLAPLTTTGPGGYTQTTGSTTLLLMQLPGGSLGPNGALRINVTLSIPANTNVKGLVLLFAGSAVISASLSTGTTLAFRGFNCLYNRGVQNSQVLSAPGSSGIFGQGTTANTVLSIDTSVNQNLSITANLSSANDFLVWDSFTIEVLPG